MNETESLAFYRESIGWTQEDLVVMIGRAGFLNLEGEPAISRITISKAERGFSVSRKMARAIAYGLNLGYEQRGREKRFTADDILDLVHKEAQKRAGQKRENTKSPDREDEQKEGDRLAVAV